MSEQINNLLRPGDEFEKFVIERELGHGGMGAVYLVRHRVLDSEFALKVLYPEIAKRDKQFVDRFIREARLAGRIHHPNLIAVHDAGYNERSGMHYLVMDYVPGVSLRKRIKQDKRIPLSEALSIIRQCADALKAAQQFNMVHRDIKPDNIMFGAHGEVRLADLGIAKASGDKEANLTQEAAVFGTPSYMSPEQAKDSSHVDTRADIFSLGVVLFEMLTGTRPFSGSSTVEILVSVISDEPAPSVLSLAPDIPADVAKLVADMLAKDLSKRIASPTELIRRIDALKLPKDTATDNNDDDEAFVTAPTMVNAVSAPSSKPNSTPTAASLEEPPQVTMPTAVPATPQQPSETPVPASSRPRLQLKSTMHTEVPATPQPSQVQSADTPQQPMPTELPEVTMPTAMPATPQQSPAPQQQSASEIPASSATSEANAEQPEQTMDMPAAAIPATATRSRKLIPILIVVAVLVLVLMISSGIILFGILTRKSGSDKPLSAESTPLSIETSTTPVADGSKQENQSSKTEQPTQKEQTPQQGTQVQTDKQDKQEQQTPKQEQKVAQQDKQEQVAQQDKREQQTPNQDKQEQKVAQQDKQEKVVQQDKQEQQTPKQEQKVAQQDKQEKVVQQDKQEQIAQQDKQEQQMPKQEQKVAQQGKQEQIAQQDKQEQQTPKQEQKVAQQDKKEPLKKEDVQQQTIAQNNPTDKNILPPGKIFLFGEDNTGTQQILSVVKSSLPGKTVTLEKAGISSKAIGQISGLQAQKPDLILVAVTSRYSSMSLTNFESKVNELLDQLISRGTNFIFVLEPTAGRNSRFCNGNDVVREACTRRGRDWLDCQTEINIDPEILLQK